jgi:hypothetical protein
MTDNNHNFYFQVLFVFLFVTSIWNVRADGEEDLKKELEQLFEVSFFILILMKLYVANWWVSSSFTFRIFKFYEYAN